MSYGVSVLSPVVARLRRDLGRIIEATSCQLSPAVLVRAREPDATRATLTPDRYADVEVAQLAIRRRPP